MIVWESFFRDIKNEVIRTHETRIHKKFKKCYEFDFLILKFRNGTDLDKFRGQEYIKQMHRSQHKIRYHSEN